MLHRRNLKGGDIMAKSKPAKLFWSERGAWVSDGRTFYRDLGKMTRAEAVKFCFLNRAVLIVRSSAQPSKEVG